MTTHQKINLLSYNIHKGKSFIFRNNINLKIKDLIHSENFDFIFLQEVRNHNIYEKNIEYKKQTEFFAQRKYKEYYGANKIYNWSHHGNAILTNHKVLDVINYDLSVNRLEKRGLLLLKCEINSEIYYICCTHLNLFKKDRLKQVKIILDILDKINEKIILVGDFNDFDFSVEKEFLNHNFKNINTQKTFPHILPTFNIDKILVKGFDNLKYNSKILHKSILLSDHLPIKSELFF